MKYRITNNQPYTGYVNLCPEDINEIPEATALEVNAADILDSIPQDQLFNFLSSLISKIRIGGTLYVGGSDAYMLTWDYLSNNITLEQFNQVIENAKAVHNGIQIQQFVQERMQMMKYTNRNRKFCIEAQRRLK